MTIAADSALLSEALCRTRTDDPFLTIDRHLSGPVTPGHTQSPDGSGLADSSGTGGPHATGQTPPERPHGTRRRSDQGVYLRVTYEPVLVAPSFERLTPIDMLDLRFWIGDGPYGDLWEEINGVTAIGAQCAHGIAANGQLRVAQQDGWTRDVSFTYLDNSARAENVVIEGYCYLDGRDGDTQAVLDCLRGNEVAR